MASNSQGKTFKLDTGAHAAPVVPAMHPRIVERMKLVALARARHAMLAKLDSLIDSLGRLSSLTGWFSTQADITRDFRDQLVSAEFADSGIFVLLDQVKQHMADLTVDFAAFDPKVEPQSQFRCVSK